MDLGARWLSLLKPCIRRGVSGFSKRLMVSVLTLRIYGPGSCLCSRKVRPTGKEAPKALVWSLLHAEDKGYPKCMRK